MLIETAVIPPMADASPLWSALLSLSYQIGISAGKSEFDWVGVPGEGWWGFSLGMRRALRRSAEGKDGDARGEWLGAPWDRHGQLRAALRAVA